uniref:TNFR-Cys domain-containing protein n=1 Tax=Anopheles minimus TaxID=112268 RepID=A0A182W815_9DIPT
MKSLATLVFLVVCTTQVYSSPDHHFLGYPDNHLSHYYDCPSVVSCHDRHHYLPHVPCKTCHGCQSCKPKKSSELYHCPYRQHGPCECKH